MTTRTFTTTIVRDGSMCFIPVTFDPKAVFGRVRAFVTALKAAPPAWQRWGELSYSHQREYVEAIEGAKRPETRVRRINAAVRAIRVRPARRR